MTDRSDFTPEQHKAAMDDALLMFIEKCRAHLLKAGFSPDDIGAAFSWIAVRMLAEQGQSMAQISDTLRTMARTADPNASRDDVTPEGLLQVAVGEAMRFGAGTGEISKAMRSLADALDADEDSTGSGKTISRH